jgi:hypothetical protein
MKAGDEMVFEGLDCSLGRVQAMVMRRCELVVEAFGGDDTDEGARCLVVEALYDWFDPGIG